MAAIVAGLLAACTPGVEDYPRELEEAICEWQHACHIYERKSDCRDALAIDSDPRFDYVQRAVEVGRIEYDGDAAADCFAAIRERNCENGDPAEEPACAAALRGRMGRNGPCIDSLECAEGGICGFDPGCSDQCCVGACRVRSGPLALGEACGGSIDCVAEGYCGPDGGGTLVCLPRVAVGADCSLGQQCEDSSVCDGAVCQALKVAEVDERCDGIVSCAEPARCTYEDDGQYCRVPPQLGAPCDPQGIACARFDTTCDEVSKLCVLLPGPGAGCEYQCAAYASCENLTSGGPNTCVRKAAAGEACGFKDDRYTECLGALQCDADQRCALPSVESAPTCTVPEA